MQHAEVEVKGHVKEWIDELKRSAGAKRLERCISCGSRPGLARATSEDDDWAVWWCFGCKCEAYGAGRSRAASCAIKTMMGLPIVITIGPLQGSLL